MYTHAHKVGPQRPCTRGIFQIYGRPKVAENAEIYAENGPFGGIFECPKKALKVRTERSPTDTARKNTARAAENVLQTRVYVRNRPFKVRAPIITGAEKHAHRKVRNTTSLGAAVRN